MAVLVQSSSSVLKNEDQHNITEFKDIKIIPLFTVRIWGGGQGAMDKIKSKYYTFFGKVVKCQQNSP